MASISTSWTTSCHRTERPCIAKAGDKAAPGGQASRPRISGVPPPAAHALPALHPDILAFLRLGLSIHVGACDAAGLPHLTRALAVRTLEGGGIVEVLVPSVPSGALLEAAQQAGQLAVVLCQPSTHRTLQLKGDRAVVRSARAQDWPQLPVNRRAFGNEIQAYGFDEVFCAAWFGGLEDSLHAIAFRPTGAWNQTPGPAAGAPIAVHAA